MTGHFNFGRDAWFSGDWLVYLSAGLRTVEVGVGRHSGRAVLGEAEGLESVCAYQGNRILGVSAAGEIAVKTVGRRDTRLFAGVSGGSGEGARMLWTTAAWDGECALVAGVAEEQSEDGSELAVVCLLSPTTLSPVHSAGMEYGSRGARRGERNPLHSVRRVHESSPLVVCATRRSHLFLVSTLGRRVSVVSRMDLGVRRGEEEWIQAVASVSKELLAICVRGLTSELSLKTIKLCC